MDLVWMILKWVLLIVVVIGGALFFYAKYFGNGVKKFYYKNGSLKSEESLNNFLPHGLCKQYYENGNKCFEKRYEYGLLCGEQISYYENGVVENKSHRSIVKILKDGKEWRKSILDGEELIYNEDGKIIYKKFGIFQDEQEIVRTYRADEKVITSRLLDKIEETQIFFVLINETILDYKNKIFVEKTYHPNNIVKEVERYKIVDIELDERKLDGLQEVYNNWGELLFEKTYQLGRLVETREYENGKIQEERIEGCIDGIEQCIQKYYHANGALRLLIPRFDGENHGILKEYSDDGRLYQETIYEKGKAIIRRTYFENGVLFLETPSFYDEFGLCEEGCGNGVEKIYYKNGQLQSIVDHKDRREEGEQKIYGSNGNLYRVVHYKKGIREGVFERYNSFGGLRVSFLFENGKKNGVTTSYRQYDWDVLKSDDGYKVSEVPYKDGKIDGLVKTYYSDGSIKAEILFENGEKKSIKKYKKEEKQA